MGACRKSNMFPAAVGCILIARTLQSEFVTWRAIDKMPYGCKAEMNIFLSIKDPLKAGNKNTGLLGATY
jgi:hypothetical protein